jgi:hypothetical protein
MTTPIEQPEASPQPPDDAVPPALEPDPTALDEALAFGRAIAQSAQAELALSTASFVRAFAHGIAAIGAVALAWAAAMVSLTLFLTAWFGAAWAFAVLAVAHGALAFFAWRRHLLWQKRIGFARTRAALATVAGLREPPQ